MNQDLVCHISTDDLPNDVRIFDGECMTHLA